MDRPLIDRTVDIVVALVILMPAAPIMMAVAILIRCMMGKPVLFRHLRAGHQGKPFELVKFRTMREACDSDGSPRPDGERLTRLGKFLRRTSLDELPQLLNVLRGQMRLVGPRPLLLDYVDRYTPRQARRLEVKPGLTGWAQINGRNSISWKERLELDVWYVRHACLRLDIWIILLTIWKVVCPEGISHPRHATMPEFMGTLAEKEKGRGDPTEERHTIPFELPPAAEERNCRKLAG